MTTLREKRKSQIPPTLARKLNHMLFVLKGAKGTTAPRHDLLTGVQSVKLRLRLHELQSQANDITNAIDKQIESIEDFYLSFASEQTKSNIARRKEIQTKIRSGRDVTDEEIEFVYPDLKKRKSK